MDKIISGKLPQSVKDIRGLKSGRLTAIKPFDRWITKGRSCIRWLCQCSCGNQTVVRGVAIRRNETRSCGCLHRDSITKHGLHKNGLYKIWDGMMSRCYNNENVSFKYYGARGIIVCRRWHKISNFTKDMGKRPSMNHSIDRIKVNKGYSKNNCRWATAKEQARNKTNSRFISLGGVTKTISEWSEQSGINHCTISRRISFGWEMKDAIFKPVHGIKIKFRGSSKTISQWSVTSGISSSLIYARIKYLKWSVYKTLSTPARSNAINNKSAC